MGRTERHSDSQHQDLPPSRLAWARCLMLCCPPPSVPSLLSSLGPWELLVHSTRRMTHLSGLLVFSPSSWLLTAFPNLHSRKILQNPFLSRFHQGTAPTVFTACRAFHLPRIPFFSCNPHCHLLHSRERGSVGLYAPGTTLVTQL